MRKFQFFLPFFLLLLWILALQFSWGKLPALGTFFSPLNGFWANANPVDQEPEDLIPSSDSVLSGVRIHFDKRLVPHIQAKSDYDLYYTQGYLHARFRLWQMDMQARAAGGRISEILGEKALTFDREQRRKGMVWGAENSLKAMQANPKTKSMLDAYTAGVNAYISNLKKADHPLEYKLMGFEPEAWTPLKTALLLKLMADDLTGKVDDIPMSYLRSKLSPAELEYYYPEKLPQSIPVIPAGTVYPSPSLEVPPVPAGQIFSDFNNIPVQYKSIKSAGHSGKGSNNWALAPARAEKAAAILCNDPHLGLQLPALWYEMQLNAAGQNCYGVSIPGAPGIVIGFNDSISWGLTNNYRDVKDYYEIKLAEKPGYYRMDSREVAFEYRYETIRIKGRKEAYTDTVKYTVHGPLIYDDRFPEPGGSKKQLAMTWMAHRSTNELFALYQLNRASNYPQFVSAIQAFECPAQNFLYADRRGNIALWGQGRFINKWKDQGKYVMRGDISATLWGDTIPMTENPHILNPKQNYLVSANQNVTDEKYPYYYNGDFSEFRSWAIHHFLQNSRPLGIPDMKRIQTSNWSPLMDKMLPVFRSLTSRSSIANTYSEEPDATLGPESEIATLFQLWWSILYDKIWSNLLPESPFVVYPTEERTMQLLLEAEQQPPAFTTAETLSALKEKAMQEALDSFQVLKTAGKSKWYQFKNTSIPHMSKLVPLGHYKLATGGWGNTINAMKGSHGPSWRMIVQMSPDAINAYGCYPGGQDGNPASTHYDDFIQDWVNGTYYKLEFLPAAAPAGSPGDGPE